MSRSDPPADETSLSEAREWLEEQLDNDGAACPCCDQYARRYRRKLNSNMAASLIRAYRAVGIHQWFHAPTVLGRNDGEFAKLHYWSLVEEERRLRPDGGRAGWWRINLAGHLFVRGMATVPAHALIYDGRLIRLDESSGRVTITEALGDKFSYRELMGEKIDV